MITESEIEKISSSSCFENPAFQFRLVVHLHQDLSGTERGNAAWNGHTEGLLCVPSRGGISGPGAADCA